MDDQRWYIVETAPEHIPFVAQFMRQADLNEIAAAGRPDPYEALWNSWQMSEKAYTVFIDEDPALIFGVVRSSLLEYRGVVWMLGTDALAELGMSKRVRYEMFRQLSALVEGYRYVENYVHDRNEVSKRWLEWMGFDLHEPVPYGPQGEPFRHFELRIH
ncbi:MAG: hypothetical protein D6698_15620 [Gammaproteobacteria bacterium]|nr:MAG: hypothetical protein D6698_15620 [Gammaproteobacteria bacterium]